MINKLFGIVIILTILAIGICITTSFPYETVKPLQDERTAIKIAVCNDLDEVMYYRIERLDHQIIEYKGEWFIVAGGEIKGNICNHDLPEYYARIYRISWRNSHTITKIIIAPNKCTKITFYPYREEYTYEKE